MAVTAGSVSQASRAGVRTLFSPRIDLATGHVVGFVAAPSRSPWPGPTTTSAADGTDRIDHLDREVADLLVVARAAGTSPAPVHLPVPADLVAWAPARLRAVRPAMLHGAGRGAGVALLLTAHDRAATTAALAQGVDHARRDGFAIALPACGFAPTEIAALAPDELVLDPDCLAGVEAREPCALASLEAATALARAGIGVLVADGVRDEALLREFRARGARIGSGPILADEQPSALPAEVVLAPGLRSRLAATDPGAVPAPVEVEEPVREVTLADVARPATVVTDAATGDDVRAAFADDQECAGVVLVDPAGRPTGYVDRNRFLLTIAGPYGRAVFAHRAAARLADPPTVRAATTPVREVVRARLDGDPGCRYDDTLLSEPDGRTVRVARFADLVRALDPAGGPAPVAAAAGPVGSGPATGASVTRRGRHRLIGLRPRPASPAGPAGPVEEPTWRR
jgi:EAL domain-containing protein (putative c-di-GMP-specific phosphodiesterase class I)